MGYNSLAYAVEYIPDSYFLTTCILFNRFMYVTLIYSC
jgi:hypothetical protein